MANLEFIAIGDLHQAGGLASLFPNYSFDPDDMSFKSLEYVFKYAFDEGIKHIFLLGDIFHQPHPSQSQQQRFLKFLSKYPHLKIFMIAGNHDYSTEDEISLEMSTFATNISDKLSHVHIYTKPELLSISGVPVSFLPWPHAKTLEKNSLNIAHIETPNSIGDTGKVLEEGYEVSKSGCYIIGHLHRKQMYKDYIYFPGTLYQRTFGEPLPKGFARGIIGYKRGQLTWDIDWIQVQPPYELHNLKIQSDSDFKLLTKPDKNNIKQYKLFVKKGVEVPIGLLEDYPNIVDVAGKLSVKEVKQLKEHGFDVVGASQNIDLIDGIDLLLEREGLTKKEIRRAHRKYINEYKKQLSYGAAID